MKIGFLFNHDQVHQVRHSLPIAMELARRGHAGEVMLLSGNPEVTAEIRNILSAQRIDLKVHELQLESGLARFLARTLNWLVPAAKLALYRDNLDLFRQLDILVVAEKTSTILKTRYGLDRLKLVHTRHGAGDRAIGFDPASRRFDHVFVAGEVLRERLITDAGVEPARISIVGYPKFDLIPDAPVRLPLQANGRPTVLYNPHVAPHLSSWYRDGRAILDYFAGSPDYNLIFAPHVMLFHRPVTVTIDPPRLHRPGHIPRRVREAGNVLIDLSSPACTDMTYTLAADIYLGDVSSQVYEFLLTPRPCIFVNSHGIEYRGNPSFEHWRAGQVIDGAAQLGEALADAVARPDRFAGEQRELFETHIELTDERSSTRAARALEGIAGKSNARDAGEER